MIEQRYTSAQLAELLDAELLGPPDLELDRLAGIDEGGPGSITFIRSEEYARKWKDSACSAALVSRSLKHNTDHDPESRALPRGSPSRGGAGPRAGGRRDRAGSRPPRR